MNKLSCSKGNQLTPILALIFTILLVIVAFSAGSVLSDSQEQRIVLSRDPTPDIKTISVTGSTTKLVAPNKVDIVLSVETVKDSVTMSQSENAVYSDKVRNALLDLGVTPSEIKTTAYYVREETVWNDVTREYEVKGYRTINQIQITLSDTKKAGSVIDVAVTAGANKVTSVSFGLTKEKELEIKRSALSEASTEAKSKADSIAQGLGINLGKVYSVSENSSYYSPYRNYDSVAVSGMGMEKSSPITPISEGDIEVTVQVSIQFEIN